MEIVEMETTSVKSYLERPTAQLMAEGINSKRKKEKLIKGLECRLW
jgi:hypothetical protein